MRTNYTGTATQKAKIRREVVLGRVATRAKVTKEGEVHVYGLMPNTDVMGWYFAGYAHEVYNAIVN